MPPVSLRYIDTFRLKCYYHADTIPLPTRSGYSREVVGVGDKRAGAASPFPSPPLLLSLLYFIHPTHLPLRNIFRIDIFLHFHPKRCISLFRRIIWTDQDSYGQPYCKSYQFLRHVTWFLWVTWTNVSRDQIR
jgi:hypothetical protein